MVARRDIGVSFAPAKRAAVAAPQARAGPLAGATRRCRTAHRGLAAAGFARLFEHLETKLCPWPLPRFFGALGARGNRRRGGRSWLRSLQALACPVVKHADMPALARPSRRTRHGGKAAPCRATPCADWLSTRPGAASFLSLAFRLLPFAVAPGSGGRRRAARAASAPANAPMAAGWARSR